MGAGQSRRFSYGTRCARVQRLHHRGLDLELRCATARRTILHWEWSASLGAHPATLVSLTDVSLKVCDRPGAASLHQTLSSPHFSACMMFERLDAQPQIAVEDMDGLCQPHDRPESLPDKAGCAWEYQPLLPLTTRARFDTKRCLRTDNPSPG